MFDRVSMGYNRHFNIKSLVNGEHPKLNLYNYLEVLFFNRPGEAGAVLQTASLPIN